MKNLSKQTYFELYQHSKLSFLAVVLGMLIVYFIPHKLNELSKMEWTLFGKVLRTHPLFHLFHYPHVTFACSTAFLNFYRYTKNLFLSSLIGLTVPLVFCILSDAILPYWVAKMIGIPMKLHLCVFNEFQTIMGFNLLGAAIAMGVIFASNLSRKISLHIFSLFSHFSHEIISAIASAIYLIGFGFAFWYKNILLSFIILFVSVVIPCLLSDFVIPVLLAKVFAKPELRDIGCCKK